MTNYIQNGTGTPVAYEEGEHMGLVNARAERNNLLAESDRYVVSDFPTEKLEEWKTYRQALRDFVFPSVPVNEEDVWNEPVFPAKPE